MEHWQPIAGFEDYSISDHGRVWSRKSDKVLSAQRNPYGYLLVELWKGGKMYRRSVHGLVARHWLCTEPSETVNHKDCDKTNNHWENLEWMTRGDNSRHSWDSGNNDHLRRVDLATMFRLRAEGRSQRQIAAALGVSQPTIKHLLAKNRADIQQVSCA